jgi:hypothetical protein
MVGRNLGAHFEQASSATRNSATFALGSTSALPKWPRCGLATFFAFAVPAPSWTAV